MKDLYGGLFYWEEISQLLSTYTARRQKFWESHCMKEIFGRPHLYIFPGSHSFYKIF